VHLLEMQSLSDESQLVAIDGVMQFKVCCRSVSYDAGYVKRLGCAEHTLRLKRQVFMAAAPKETILKKTVDAIAARSVHISLESDVSETRAKPDTAKSLASFELRNPARGTRTEISILRDHYVQVTTARRSVVQTHNVDLRFMDPKPMAFRHVAWRWLYAALGLALITAVAILSCVYLRHFGLVAQYGISTSIACGTATICCALACYYLTSETLLFLSVNGRIPMVGITGTLGMLRRARACAGEVVKRAKIARVHIQQSKSSYLRDEMREHTRLFEQGALTDAQYNEAKLRILKAHD